MIATPRIALTSGEPAGIGPELCLALALEELPCELVCLADESLLAERARQLKLSVTLRPYARKSGAAAAPHSPGTLVVEHRPLARASVPGQPDTANVPYVLALLERAVAGALGGEFDALVTAPVHKRIINDAGVRFSGHTEFLAERTASPRVLMLLTTGELRVALATTHLPLRAVCDAITVDSLYEAAVILARELKRSWAIPEPRIAVCGLNPHAGEGGYLGEEELRVITPAIARMQAAGIRASGPLPADTVFVPQVLAGFERAVNVTLGLPIVRTSPDHGTALDLAGSGRADHGSLSAAVRLASRLAAQRR